MDTEKLNKTVAIDFGTTNSVGGIFKNNKIDIIPADKYGKDGTALIPSFVEYRERGVVVGRAAKNNFGKKNKFVVAAVKRIIGQRYEEYERMEDKTIFGCEVVRGDDGYPYFIVSEDGRRVSAIEVASEIFKVMKKRADEYGDRKFSEAYVTVPANFKDHQCKAIKKAAEIAGLKVLKLITEPTAAAMSWCFDHADELKVGENMIVYDFGGGTFDVSLIQYFEGKRFRVRTVDGNPNLGGNDIDNAILDHMVKKCERITGVDISKKAYSRRYRCSLRSSCEDAKIIITDDSNPYYNDDENTFIRNSSSVNHQVTFSDLSMDGVDDIDCTTRDLNDAIRKKVEETVDITIRMMEKENVMPKDIRYVMLVGGSSYLYLVRQLLHKEFIGATFPIMKLNEAVAQGTMKLLMSDCDPNSHENVEEKIVISYGLQVNNHKVALILKRGDIIPQKPTPFFFTTIKDNMKYIKTRIFQWEGDPNDPNQVELIGEYTCIPKEKCTLIEELSFKNKFPKAKEKQNLSIEFPLDIGGTLEVRCWDGNAELYANTFNAIYGGAYRDV